ncbi:PEP-CTERM sorting domain-containing protein [Methyloversatilis discipulorum]|uniref:PEP-CTERM sorting domain-containing protein n=1 Tax=Methyloversatilis discipulorum TaxID=1119528 RepID=UPI000379FE8F|nr:PEP-CTERM sorting domain-containing protein [Methyloversatilis discipulorum]
MNVTTKVFVAAGLLASIVAAVPAQAASLSGTYTADDYATVYLSTDLLADASEIISDKTTLWGSSETFSGAALAAGQDYYLLIRARNVFSGPAMFIGDFSISGEGFRFANGGQTLSTGTAYWTVNESGFGAPGATPVSLGTNAGLQIWGQRQGISADAEAIWAYYADWSAGYNGPAYFVAQIVAVPEPGSWAMFGAGLALLAMRRRAVER